MKKSPFLLIGILCLLVKSYSQAQEKLTASITLAQSPIHIDGIMDEPAWQSIEPLSTFWNHRPNDVGQAKAQTAVYLSYDERFLYFGFTCKSLNNRYILESLKRDQFFSDDGIGIVLDPAMPEHMRGTANDTLVSVLDIAPTFVDRADQPHR